jgi:hypothetical protein
VTSERSSSPDESPSAPVRDDGPTVITVNKPEPWMHITVWFVGVILASLVPIIWAEQSAQPANPAPNINEILGHGDLYLISVILLIAGITEIILSLRLIPQTLVVAMLILGGFLLVTVDAARYAGASSVSETGSTAASVTHWSLALFVISVVHSSICVGLEATVK